LTSTTARSRKRPSAREWRRALTRPSIVLLVLIVVLGGGLRAREAAAPDVERQSADERSYQKLAINLSEQGHYGDASTGLRRPLHWPPGAPAMFAVGHRLDPSPDVPAAYWLQALAGTATIPVTFALAALIAGSATAGLLAAAAIAFYPPQIALSGELLSEGLGTFLLASAALAVVWAVRAAAPTAAAGTRGWWRFALAGGVFALAILTRADMLLAPAAVAAVLVAAGLRRRRRALLAGAGVLLVATAVALAPWILYASARADRFVAVTEGDAAPLFVGTYLPGNGSTSGMKDVLGPAIQKSNPRYRGVWVREIPASVILDRVAARHPELAREDALRREARRNLRRYALGDPLEFGAMMAVKVGRMWLLSSRVGAPTAATGTRVAHVVLVLASTVLTLAAIVVGRERLLLLTLLAIPAYSSLLHAVVVSRPRYNLTLLPLLLAAGCAAAVLLVRSRAAATAPPAILSGR
jgi:hypothetical protein